MKSLTLMELIIVSVVLALFSGIFYCIFEINSLKLKAEFVQEMQDWKEWRKGVTVIMNHNLQNKKIEFPPVTPRLSKGD